MSYYLKSEGMKRLFSELLKRSIISVEIRDKIWDYERLRKCHDKYDEIDIGFDNVYFEAFYRAKNAEEKELIDHYREVYDLTDDDIKSVKRMVKEMEL